MVLFDEDGFDLVVLNDGSIVQLSSISSGDEFTPLGGEWNFEALGSGGLVSNLNNFYLIQAVPVPAAVWLFGSGLLGLVGMARRKKAA